MSRAWVTSAADGRPTVAGALDGAETQGRAALEGLCRVFAEREILLVLDNLEQVGPGHYVSTEPMPVSGTWKTLLRVHDGRTLAAVPIFLAGDPGIGAEEVPAEAQFTRPFVSEITILQRERSPDIPESLWLIGCLIVLACTLAMVAGVTWGGGRINNNEPSGSDAELQPSAQS